MRSSLIRCLAAFALGAAAPAFAQDPAVDSLSTNLRTLAANPRNLPALLGAGEAAVAVGDPNAALGFFSRAEEIDPRNARAKAGLGSALVMLERPDDALKFFGEAVALGASEAQIAKDRGLAYDLRGDNRRAQRDYSLALSRGQDDETTRRLALSLGISGDRVRALNLLDPLLRKKDQGAWRARAFILAMNGDVQGGDTIARTVMPGGVGYSMGPFLTRLATLNPADRAHAVNFGTMPSDGRQLAVVETGDPYRTLVPTPEGSRAGDALIPAGDPFGPRPEDIVRRPAPQPVSREPRRIPGRDPVTAAATPPPQPGFSTMATTVTTSTGTRNPMIARVSPPAPETRVPAAEAPPPAAERPVFETAPRPPVEAPARAVEAVPLPPSAAPATPTSTPDPARIEPAPAAPVRAVAERPANRLAAILAGIEPEPESAPVALPSATELRAVRAAQARKAAIDAKTAAAAKAAADEAAAEREAARRNPARLWVQIATGNNERGLPGTWKRLQGAHDALDGRSAWSAPFKATNRLLVGPLKSAADARALVNALAKSGLSATLFNSDAGQDVARIGR